MESRRIEKTCKECGKTFMAPTSPSRVGRGKYCSRSCGNSATGRTHGLSVSDKRTYTSWAMMLNRCRNPNAPNFDRYGGRGIEVCERWKSFENFIADMGKRPDGKTLDRKNPNDGYYPENCVWSSVKTQQRNRRNNVMITHNGKTQCASDWASELGINKNTLLYRLKHWPIDRALTPILRAVA